MDSFIGWVGGKKANFTTRSKNISVAIERFEEIQERLAGVLIENRDFKELMKVYDTSEVLVYADPPYHTTEKY